MNAWLIDFRIHESNHCEQEERYIRVIERTWHQSVALALEVSRRFGQLISFYGNFHLSKSNISDCRLANTFGWILSTCLQKTHQAMATLLKSSSELIIRLDKAGVTEAALRRPHKYVHL